MEKTNKKKSKSVLYSISSVLIFFGIILNEKEAQASIVENLGDAVSHVKDMAVDGVVDLVHGDFKKLKEDESRDGNRFLDSSEKMIKDIKNAAYNASEIVDSEIDKVKDIVDLKDPIHALRHNQTSITRNIEEDQRRLEIAEARLEKEALEDVGYIADRVDKNIQAIKGAKVVKFLVALANGLMEEEKDEFKQKLKIGLMLGGFRGEESEKIIKKVMDRSERKLQEGDSWLYENIASFYDKMVASTAKRNEMDPGSPQYKELQDRMKKAARWTATGIEVGGTELITAGAGGMIGLGMKSFAEAEEVSVGAARAGLEASEAEKGVMATSKSTRVAKDSESLEETEAYERKTADENQSEKARDHQENESDSAEDCTGRSKRSPGSRKNTSRCKPGQTPIRLSLSPGELLKKDIESAGFEEGAKFKAFSVETKSNIEFKLERNRLEHILENHHKRYLGDRNLIFEKSLFPDNWRVKEIVERLEQIVLENTGEITSLYKKGMGYHKIEVKYGNNSYLLGIHPTEDPNKFLISQFYPKVMRGRVTSEM